MKTVLYRFQTLSSPDGDGFFYGSMTVPSKTKVTEEMCLRNEFGKDLDSR